jgi:hypothetical protein
MAKDAHDHRRAPAQLHQHLAQHQHGEDFGNLPQRQHHHREIARNAHAVGQEGVGHHEIAVMHHRSMKVTKNSTAT